MALVRKELIRPERPVFSGERAFRFRHLLIRDAAYESLPKEARVALHERHAGWLEGKAGARAVEYEEILGYHLEQAFRYRVELGAVGDADRALARRAAERLGAAGRRAFARGDGPPSINLISRAVSLLPADDPSRVELVPTMRVFQGMPGDLGWAHAVPSEAIAAGDPRLEAHATVQRAFLRLYNDAAVTADELATSSKQALRTFEELCDELGLARAWRLRAEACYLARRAGEITGAFLRALEHVRRAENLQEEHEILWWLSMALFHGPTPEAEGIDVAERLLEDRTRDPIGEGVLAGLVAVLVAMAGKPSEARELVERVRKILDEPHARFTVPVFSSFAGNVELLAGDAAASERELRCGYEVCEEMGERSNFSSIAAMLAEAVYAQGRYEDAERLTRVSEEASRGNDVHANIIWRSAGRRSSRGEDGCRARKRSLARQSPSPSRVTSSMRTGMRCSTSRRSSACRGARSKPFRPSTAQCTSTSRRAASSLPRGRARCSRGSFLSRLAGRLR